MKKHLQFNDITALSLGWRAARRKAEKERRVEREKEQSSSSLLCIFIKENITSFPLLFSFSFSSFDFFVSLIYIFFLSCLSVLCSLLPFSYIATDSLLFSLHCVSLFIDFGHSVSLIRSCLSHNVSFFLCCTPIAIAHSQQDCRRDYNVSFQSTTNLLSCLPSLLLFPLILVILFHIHCGL